MKRFLKKKWHRIPVGIMVALIALMLVGGSVLAAYNVWMGNAHVTVVESITVSNTTGDSGEAYTGSPGDYAWDVSLYPGESKSLNVLVSNASSVVVPITTTGAGNEGVAAGWSGPANVPATGSVTLTLTVTAAGDTYPGPRTIFFMIERG